MSAASMAGKLFATLPAITSMYVSLMGRCILCLQDSCGSEDLCRYCEADLPRFADAAIFVARGDCEPYQRQHLQLSSHIVPAVVAPLTYEREIIWLINQQKQAGGRIASRVLANLLATSIVTAYRHRDLPARIVPVPLHWRQDLRRGMNQSQVLAQWLTQRLGVRSQPDWIVRHRATAKQSSLGYGERQTNVAGAFRTTPRGNAQIKDQTIAVVDDVITTGATLNAVAACLFDAGAKEVHLWAPARAPYSTSGAT